MVTSAQGEKGQLGTITPSASRVRPDVSEPLVPASGHPRSKPASRRLKQGSFTARARPGVRSQAVPVSGHPRSKPASRPPLP